MNQYKIYDTDGIFLYSGVSDAQQGVRTSPKAFPTLITLNRPLPTVHTDAEQDGTSL